MILIIGQSCDPHISNVISHLDRDFFLFCRYSDKFYLTMHYNNNVRKVTLESDDGTSLLLDKNIHAVWWRPKPILDSEIPGGFKGPDESLRVYEWKYALSSLEQILEHSIWINKIDVYMKMSRKPYQLTLAVKHGLCIPNTVVSNKCEDILNLFDHGEVIYKTLSSFCTPEKVIYTNKVTKNQILDGRSSIELAPGIFQNYIDKLYELRVTIINDKVFIYKVNSQEKKSTKTDWRYQQDPRMFSSGKLSDDVTQKLLNFHRDAKLKFATYDFIVDTEGKEIFLECNPSGQWLLSNPDISTQISKEMALYLSAN